MRGLAAIVMIAMMVGMGFFLMLGWMYEGPRRLIVRLKGGKI
jgi:hypothetical protein